MWLPCTMGCGQSKTVSKSASDNPDQDSNYNDLNTPETEKSVPHDDGTSPVGSNQALQRRSSAGGVTGSKSDPLHNGELRSSSDTCVDLKIKMDKGSNTSTLPVQKPSMSDSQIEFFRMLDDKIEKGKDYSSEEDNCT